MNRINTMIVPLVACFIFASVATAEPAMFGSNSDFAAPLVFEATFLNHGSLVGWLNRSNIQRQNQSSNASTSTSLTVGFSFYVSPAQVNVVESAADLRVMMENAFLGLTADQRQVKYGMTSVSWQFPTLAPATSVPIGGEAAGWPDGSVQFAIFFDYAVHYTTPSGTLRLPEKGEIGPDIQNVSIPELGNLLGLGSSEYSRLRFLNNLSPFVANNRWLQPVSSPRMGFLAYFTVEPSTDVTSLSVQDIYRQLATLESTQVGLDLLAASVEGATGLWDMNIAGLWTFEVNENNGRAEYIQQKINFAIALAVTLFAGGGALLLMWAFQERLFGLTKPVQTVSTLMASG